MTFISLIEFLKTRSNIETSDHLLRAYFEYIYGTNGPKVVKHALEIRVVD